MLPSSFAPCHRSALCRIIMKKEFSPQLTPQEMLEFGVFGGWYFKGDIREYPKAWFKKAKLSNDGFDEKLNYFEIRSGQTMSVWKKKGWITPEDPLGWFQWYCRFKNGRRISQIDEIQIKRWKAFRRHVTAIKKNCEPEDIYCRRRQRQAILQWAYNPFI